MKKKNRIILGALSANELLHICKALETHKELLDDFINDKVSQGLPCTIKSTERRILKGVTRKIQACLQDQCNEENSD